MRVVSFKAEEDLARLLEVVARRERITKSELIRRALKKYLFERNEQRVIVTRKMRIYL